MPNTPQGPATHPEKWRLVAERLHGDIQCGLLKPGSRLGTSPAEAEKLGASHPTLRKALRHLIRIGVLEPAPRGAQVPRPWLPGRLPVVLIRPEEAARDVLGEAERESQFRRELELQCQRAGFAMQTWLWDRSGALRSEERSMDVDPSLRDRVWGFVIPLWGLDETPDLVERIARLGLPVSVWDERPTGGAIPQGPRVRTFSSGYARDAGGEMLRHLAGMGHRAISYVSPFHGSLWSRARAEGIREAAQGLGVSLREVVSDRIAEHTQLETGPAPESFLNAADLASHLGPSLDPTTRELRHRVLAALRMRNLLALCEPLFEEALAPDATAWILANDDVALLAREWLRTRGVPVGERLALAGFDNLLAAQDAGLTSFHFNEGSLAGACLNHLVDSRSPAAAHRRTIVPGFVVPRASTATRARAP